MIPMAMAFLMMQITVRTSPMVLRLVRVHQLLINPALPAPAMLIVPLAALTMAFALKIREMLILMARVMYVMGVCMTQ